MKNARMTAISSDSTYSRDVDFRGGVAPGAGAGAAAGAGARPPAGAAARPRAAARVSLLRRFIVWLGVWLGVWVWLGVRAA